MLRAGTHPVRISEARPQGVVRYEVTPVRAPTWTICRPGEGQSIEISPDEKLVADFVKARCLEDARACLEQARQMIERARLMSRKARESLEDAESASQPPCSNRRTSPPRPFSSPIHHHAPLESPN